MISVRSIDTTFKFDKEFSAVPSDIQQAAKEALKTLLSNPCAKKIRLHPLKAHKPTIWKIDILPNHSWQIAFEMQGNTAVLLHIGRHKRLDSLY